MEQQIFNQQILEKLNQIQIDINIIKKKLPEDESDNELFVQVNESLEDAKAGRIRRIA